MCKFVILVFVLSLLSGCATLPPSNPGNICSIFQEKEDWYANARDSSRRWGAPIEVQMAIINQESSFIDDARPERVHFLGIPLWRPTSAYGYGQAKDETWEGYMEKTGNSGADRDDFADACDFIGWYVHQSYLKLSINKTDAYSHYLAYHEGQNGFKRGTYKAKPWLQGVAKKVANQALRYQRQLENCRGTLESAL